jgi:hypothetical protein
MTAEEVAVKFRDCAAWAGLPDDGAEIRGLVERLPELTDLAELTDALLG